MPFCRLALFAGMFLGLRVHPDPKIHLCSRVNGGPWEEVSCRDLTQRDRCVLSVLMELETSSSTSDYYVFGEPEDDQGTVTVGRKTVQTKPWPGKRPTIEWFKVEPIMKHRFKGPDPTVPWFRWYANAHVPGSPKAYKWMGLDPIQYVEHRIPGTINRATILADAHPTLLLHDLYDGLGVMRYAVQVTIFGKPSKSPSIKCVNDYGIKDDLFKLVVRRDDSYLGYATSYFNVPGVFGSVKRQSDQLTGVDCADLVVGAYRRWKNSDYPYTNVNGLVNQLKHVTDVLYLTKEGELREDNAMKREAKVKWKAGLIMVFDYKDTTPRSYVHVALLYEDDGDGFVGGKDTLLHAGPKEAHLSRLGDACFAGNGGNRVMLLTWSP